MSQWLRSNKANTLFLYSAWVVVCLGIFMIFMMTPWFSEIEARPRADLFLRILVSPLAILAAPASLIILFGMAAFCVREDRSTISTKIFWFILFLATACFGAAAYFFRVNENKCSNTRKHPFRPKKAIYGIEIQY
jgi:nitrate reductase gamma subunit